MRESTGHGTHHSYTHSRAHTHTAHGTHNALTSTRIRSEERHKSIFEKQKNDKLHESFGCYCCRCCGGWSVAGNTFASLGRESFSYLFVLFSFPFSFSSVLAFPRSLLLPAAVAVTSLCSLFSINQINCIFVFVPYAMQHTARRHTTSTQIQWKTGAAAAPVTPTTAILVFINLSFSFCCLNSATTLDSFYSSSLFFYSLGALRFTSSP